MRQVGSSLWPGLRTLQIYGANTGIGKTIFSTILCHVFQRKLPNVYYLKPVSTGSLDEADDHHVTSFGRNIKSKCLYRFSDPVSPHIAVRSSAPLITPPVTDAAIQAAVFDELQGHANNENEGIALVETAGGVLSPTPSGSSQADLYRPLKLPVLLVGDHKLGGIGTTISAWESLHIRGYDVHSVALFAEDRYDNHSYLKDYFADRNVHTFSVEPPPERKASHEEDSKAMQVYYDNASRENDVNSFAQQFLQAHETRINDLRRMPAVANQIIWHPFLQHLERTRENIVVMDSAYGDYFQTYTTQHDLARSTNKDAESSLTTPAFDGSASWWTQGLGHGNPRLALTAAHAAGRYGHVMFASAIHEPALTLAQTLISKMGNSRLSKVFYTDNGSTGMEVAVKMALRAAAIRNEWSPDDEILILGLTNSYHGDTIGVMSASEPSIFNTKVEWYSSRGHWFDFPQVKMRRGKWLVEPPQGLESLGKAREFASLDQIFDFDSRVEDRNTYRSYLDAELSRLQKQGKKFGALIIEPILLGAGGMVFADPLFQRSLVEAVRQIAHDSGANEGSDWSGMPIIFDEVFTGLYRLGRFSAASFLGIDPDIVVNAKLLTGGLLPLCTTTTSQAVFDAFLSNDKSDALLHGHSYTAHPIGCAVANESLKAAMKLESDGSWNGFRSDWQISTSAGPHLTVEGTSRATWSMWSHAFVTLLSHKANVDSVFALGSVLAISLKDPTGSGYASTAAIGLRDHLLAGSPNDEWVIHSRVLGNVLYLMAALTTTADTLRGVEEKVIANLE